MRNIGKKLPSVKTLLKFLGCLGFSAFMANSALADQTELEDSGDKTTITAAVTLDENMSAGDTDNKGDHKAVELVARTAGGSVYAVETGLITPQGKMGAKKSDRVALRDTSFAQVTYGGEGRNTEKATHWGGYAHLGIANDKATQESWVKVIKKSHGGNLPRTSPLSSEEKIIAGVSGYLDKSYKLAQAGPATFNADVAVFGHASTMKVSAGAATYLSANFGNAVFKPTLPGMPTQKQEKGVSVYAGLTAEAKAYDRPTEFLGTKRAVAAAVLGVALRIGRGSLGMEYNKPLTDEVRGGFEKPVGKIKALLSFSF